MSARMRAFYEALSNRDDVKALSIAPFSWQSKRFADEMPDGHDRIYFNFRIIDGPLGGREGSGHTLLDAVLHAVAAQHGSRE